MNPQQPDYSFITQSNKNNKPKIFAPKTTKERITLVGFGVGVIITLFIAGSLIINLFTVDNSQKLVDLAATQNEIQRIMDLGTANARDSKTKIYAQIGSTTLESHKQTTIKLAAQQKIKISAKQLIKNKTSTIDKQLDSAKSANKFDEVFNKVYEDQIASYNSKLKTMYGDEKDKKIKPVLAKFFKDASIMSMSYKTSAD